ncbi:hypothetical protein Nepgr_020994 [Nepenthes gracilis]|uniref:RWP-RK domain-containing protein n=1 Tax=Nepenthes gracilis TaxID=150966 RepID=A0AAD3XVR3_NEPGR|nr:hypothetical protein Nepgr_020994 [Nepenthes gracilis]
MGIVVEEGGSSSGEDECEEGVRLDSDIGMPTIPAPKIQLQCLSFEDVSKFFSLPLSEAADILGVSTSVLKTICNENGLERWPNSKYLAGKSIEEIKKEAARGKTKASSKSHGSAVSSLGSPLKGKTSKPVVEMSKSHGFTQHLGNRKGLTVETSADLDEFKHGFPSNGLLISNFKRWGGGTPDTCDGRSEIDSETVQEDKCRSEEQVDDGVSECMKKAEVRVEECLNDKQGTVSLTALRKQAVDEGRQALKLGVWKDHGFDSLEKKEKILLHRLFMIS